MTRPFSARRIGFSPQWKLCASVETSLDDDDDDDDVFSGLSCYAQVCLGYVFSFLAWLCFTRCFLWPGGSRSGWIRFIVRFARFSKGRGFLLGRSYVFMFMLLELCCGLRWWRGA